MSRAGNGLDWRRVYVHLYAAHTAGERKALAGSKTTLVADKGTEIEGGKRGVCIDKGSHLVESTIASVGAACTGGKSGREGVEDIGDLVAQTVDVVGRGRMVVAVCLG
jgi:hypothetical protein